MVSKEELNIYAILNEKLKKKVSKITEMHCKLKEISNYNLEKISFEILVSENVVYVRLPEIDNDLKYDSFYFPISYLPENITFEKFKEDYKKEPQILFAN